MTIQNNTKLSVKKFINTKLQNNMKRCKIKHKYETVKIKAFLAGNVMLKEAKKYVTDMLQNFVTMYSLLNLKLR